MRYLTAVHTDIGIKKNTNQDSALIMEAKTSLGNVLLAVVCDGMGGLAKGEVASSTIISAFSKWFEQDLPSILAVPNLSERLLSSWEKIVFSCNDRISAYGRLHGCAMGSTLCASLFFNNKYYVLNVGDSRFYQISDRLIQVTKDQTYVQREMDMGRMTIQEAATSPKRNVLLQCIGASEYIEPDFFEGDFSGNQVFLLCSDGFRHVITPQEIYERTNPNVLIDERSMLENAVYLTDLNKYRRENDNITVLLVRAD